jgi:hypothetical protein
MIRETLGPQQDGKNGPHQIVYRTLSRGDNKTVFSFSAGFFFKLADVNNHVLIHLKTPKSELYQDDYSGISQIFASVVYFTLSIFMVECSA